MVQNKMWEVAKGNYETDKVSSNYRSRTSGHLSVNAIKLDIYL